MKKIIAISVMLALVATGAVFAQPTIGGNLKISTALLGGDQNADDVWTGGSLNQSTGNSVIIWDAFTNVSWSGDNAGGFMRLWTNNNEWTPDHFVFWWWNPTDWWRMQLGQDADGIWGHQQIGGWGFNAEAQGGIVLDEHRGLNGLASNVARGGGENLFAIWAPSFGGLGFYNSFTPMPGLQIGLAIPMAGGRQAAAQTYLNSDIDIVYRVGDVGTLRVRVDLRYNHADEEFLTPNLWGAFHLIALDGIGLEFGVAYVNASDDVAHIGLGLGASIGITDVFDIRLRAGFELGNAIGDLDSDNSFGIGILPRYRFGNVTGFLNAGFGMNLDRENADGDAQMDWFVNPYITIPANVGTFYMGFKLLGGNHGVVRENVMWEIPIGWNVYF